MSASQQAKAEGLKSLNQVAELSGQSVQTLNNWSKNKCRLYSIVLLGCKSFIDKDQIHDPIEKQLDEKDAVLWALQAKLETVEDKLELIIERLKALG